MIERLADCDGFVYFDLSAPQAVGYARQARKVLERSSIELARSATYTFASFGIPISGAAAALNTPAPSDHDDATSNVGRFTDAVSKLSTGSSLRLLPHLGFGESQLNDEDGAVSNDLFYLSRDSLDASLAASVLGALRFLRWSGSVNRIAIEGEGHPLFPKSLLELVAQEGIEIVEPSPGGEPVWAEEVDVLVCGSKPGVLDELAASMARARYVVPWGPSALTTKAFATLLRRDTLIVPGFISASGGLIASIEESFPEQPSAGADFNESIAAKTENLLGELNPHAMMLEACEKAEAYMQSWATKLPFGRPFAA